MTRWGTICCAPFLLIRRSSTSSVFRHHVFRVLGEHRPFHAVVDGVLDRLEDLAVRRDEESGPPAPLAYPGQLGRLIAAQDRVLGPEPTLAALNRGIVIEQVDADDLQAARGVVAI